MMKQLLLYKNLINVYEFELALVLIFIYFINGILFVIKSTIEFDSLRFEPGFEGFNCECKLLSNCPWGNKVDV